MVIPTFYTFIYVFKFFHPKNSIIQIKEKLKKQQKESDELKLIIKKQIKINDFHLLKMIRAVYIYLLGKVHFLNSQMNKVFKILLIVGLLIALCHGYTLSVTLDNNVINIVTGYTFVFGFANNNVRNVTLNFPGSSDLTSASLAIYINNSPTALATSSYTVSTPANTIVLNNVTPSSNTLTIRVTSIKNPPSAIQWNFNTQIVPTQSLTISVPYANYGRGSLTSCEWKFSQFTGSTNSTVDIAIVLGDKLLVGNNQLIVQFPSIYQDSDTQYLTSNSTPIITYSIDNGSTYLSPLSSPSSSASNTRISFYISLAASLPASSVFKIRFTGIVNPPTTNPSGKGFIVSTYDSSGYGIDTISQCTVDPVSVLELQGTFDQTNPYVNSPYANPQILIYSQIPFNIFQNDGLQFDHNASLQITNTTPLYITLTRGSPFVAFYLDLTQPSNSVTSYFVGNLQNTNSGNAYSAIQFMFTINAPSSQSPWDFTVWLTRSSGAYVKIVATLQAVAIPINSANVAINALSTEMSVQSQYTLNIALEEPITRGGKILLGFNPDFGITSGACTGSINGSQITSTSSCGLATRSGIPFLQFKINDTLSSILDTGTTIAIQYSSSTIRNPLYPNAYTFMIYVYYTEFDDSLVEQALVVGSVQMTTHYSLKGGLLTNDFTVYDTGVLTITYVNDVYIPQNTQLRFVLPTAVDSFSFVGNISINGVNVTNATFDQSFAGGKTGQVTIRQPISPGTQWQISLLLTMPNIAGDYPSITFQLMNSSVVYEQVSSGLNIRVKYPSTQLTALMEPKTNTKIDATTDYVLRLISRVPLPGTFYIILTTPPEITIGANLSCVTSNGTCSSIQQSSPTVLNLTLTNSPYNLSQTVQQFTFTVNSFVNPRFEGSSSPWTIQLNGLYNGAVAAISSTTVSSTTFVHSTSLLCAFDPTKNYYKGNTQTVVINCTFANNLIQGDYVEVTFTNNAYQLNPAASFSCASPTHTNFILCTNPYNQPTTMKIGVTVLTTFTTNKNQLTLEISGLISYPSTTYYDPTVAIPVSRYDGNVPPRLIDTGVFYYDINCNENSSIITKNCKTCMNNVCTSCPSSTFFTTNGTCVWDCASTTQFRALNNLNTSQCEPCASPCYTCENSSSTCLTCINSSYYLYRSSSTCQLICDTTSLNWINTVSLPGQKICDPCLTECRVCVNGSFNGCLQCQTGYVLENGVCLSNCTDPNSYIFNSVCIKCDPACATCTGSGSNNCIQCKQLYYMYNGFCVAQCPSNVYPLSNWTCGCEGQCAQCTYQSPTFCTQCINSTNFIYEGTCLSSCPNNTVLLGGRCVNCPNNCGECTSGTTCTACIAPYHIYAGSCYFDCNMISLQYDSKGNSCVLCPTGCDTCSGDICSSCLQGYSKNGTECIKSCMITNTCTVENPVPSVVTPLPATIVFFVWLCVVLIAKFFNPKIYPPYAVMFFTAAIQLCLILGTAIYTGQLTSKIIARLLTVDLTQRSIILDLLIVAVVLNYVMNAIFAVIFWKYIYPLVKDPRQVDYITIGVVTVLGLLTNYRFTLLMFSKMFPKPKIHVQFASRLTPIHYLCITSILLSGVQLAASGIILKNEYPLTDIFMLGIDILIIEIILILFSIWMVATNKNESYFENDTKKYHLEDNQRTEGNVFENTEEKNASKHQLQIRDQFSLQGQLPDDNLRNSITDSNYKKLLSKTSILNVTNLNQASDVQKPLTKISQTSKVNVQQTKPGKNKIENSFDSDISSFNKTKKSKNPSTFGQNQQLKSKIKEIDSGKKKSLSNLNILEGSDKKFETSDDDRVPQKVEIKQNDNILVDIGEPQSDDIPNLPTTNSVFHDKAMSDFGHRIKPTKINSKANQQKSQVNLKTKSPKSNKTLKAVDIVSKTSPTPNMKKKKNRFFESEVESEIFPNNSSKKEDKKQSPNHKRVGSIQISEMDIESIIKSKIVVIENKDENKLANTTLGDPNNLSSIDKKEDQNSQYNEQVSPSWFNIQNQRFDFSEMGSQFSDN